MRSRNQESRNQRLNWRREGIRNKEVGGSDESDERKGRDWDSESFLGRLARQRRARSPAKPTAPRLEPRKTIGARAFPSQRAVPKIEARLKNKQEERRSEIRRTTDTMIKRSRAKRTEQIEAGTNAGLPNQSRRRAQAWASLPIAHRSAGAQSCNSFAQRGYSSRRPTARQTLSRNLCAISAHFQAAAGPCGSSLEPGLPRPSCAVFPSKRRIPSEGRPPPSRQLMRAKPSRLARFSRPAPLDRGARIKTPSSAPGFGPAFCARTSSCRPSPNRRRGGLARSQ